MNSSHKTTVNQFGFVFGPADITRTYSDDRLGVFLCVKTAKQELEIRVTNSGIIKTSIRPIKEKKMYLLLAGKHRVTTRFDTPKRP